MTRTRNYVGLACTGHDNAVAVVGDDGELRFAEAIERHLQHKRALDVSPVDLSWFSAVIDRYCDPNAEIVVAKTWSNQAATHFERERKHVARRLRQVARVCQKAELDPAFRRSLADLGGMLDEYDHIVSFVAGAVARADEHLSYVCQKRTRDRRSLDVRAYPHHLTHAAAAAFTSPFTEATCAVVDGFGEGASSQFYRYVDGALRAIPGGTPARGDMGQSLGLFYADLCRWCGFDPWQGEEWKVMGLAPYGEIDERLCSLLRRYVAIDGLQVRYPAEGLAALPEILAHARPRGVDARSAAALARSGQSVFCELLERLLRNLYEVAPSDHLVLGGGCALNSSCNGGLLQRTPFRELHVFAAPADDGNAVGAALLAYDEDHPNHKRRRARQSPYLGSALCEDALIRLLRHSGALVERVADPAGVAAQLLSEGKILGWAQGRAELGPRALGNRSILADPRPVGMKDRINAQVKFREEFRPFAPAILHEHGATYFVDYCESPYMERTFVFRQEVRGRVPAVVHEDGTGRVQSIRADWNPRFHALVERFYELTNVPLVLNTSFNVMGKPIIHSVEDAVAVFHTTGLDALVLGDLLVLKSARS